MMKYIKSILLMAVLVFGVVAARCEAATIAIVPLVNAVEFNTKGDEQVPNAIFYNEAMGILKKSPGYVLVDNARLRHAVEEELTFGKLPTKEQMLKVSKRSKVDILVAAMLTNYGRKPVQKSVHETNMQMDVKAKVVTYNRLTGKFESRNYVDDRIYDATLESRFDLVQESWGRLVRRMFSNIAKVKER
ncbi:MAG: hypothetical protein MJ041_03625 [Acidaminococcaceae bacterium]|nr:hypothetical protein [Acidaminococcaceae bacterium]